MNQRPWPKKCGCGAVWTREQWSQLPFLAVWDIEGGPTHELRNCHCHTTLAVDVSALEVGAGANEHVEPAPVSSPPRSVH